jgi:hypothetical protein
MIAETLVHPELRRTDWTHVRAFVSERVLSLRTETTADAREDATMTAKPRIEF